MRRRVRLRGQPASSLVDKGRSRDGLSRQHTPRVQAHRRVLLVHAEGNINSNPNLTGIVELLAESGYRVILRLPRLPIPQFAPSDGVELQFRTRFVGRAVRKLAEWTGSFRLLRLLFGWTANRFRGTDLVIGVDTYGGIEASVIAKRIHAPLGFISYEIFFRSEVGDAVKNVEVCALRDLEFAICQDSVRAGCLSSENAIDIGKIHTIPVAGRGSVPGLRTSTLHDELGIDRSKRVALLSGSIANWGMVDDLLATLPEWPEDWVLVLHDRYNGAIARRKFIEHGRPLNCFVSSLQVPDIRLLGTLLQSADVGIALYRPTYGDRYTGLNLANIGLSSGKISTYLQNGIPVIVNELGQMSTYVRNCRLGGVVESAADIPATLAALGPREDYADRCRSFFESRLDLNLFASRLESVVSASIHPETNLSR